MSTLAIDMIKSRIEELKSIAKQYRINQERYTISEQSTLAQILELENALANLEECK